MVSRIWSIDRDTLVRLIAESDTFSSILAVCGLNTQGGNVKTLKRRLDIEGIDYSRIQSNNGRFTKAATRAITVPLDKVLVIDSTYKSSGFRKRLINSGLLINKCYVCGLDPFWNNQPLTLRLDHINGIHNDCRIENLRLVCPNCDSQLPTFGSKNKRKRD